MSKTKYTFKEPFDIVPLENHSDPRGNLFEILRFKDWGVPGEGYIYTFTINPGQRRGDHYHERKLEWAACVAGEAVVLFEDKDGNQTKAVLTPEKPTLVYFGPGTSHAFYNESDKPAVLISYGSKQHDPNDQDTIPKFIHLDQ